MLRFTSERERRLWLWALVVVVAIYSTLGLAGTLGPALIARGLLDVMFAVAFLLAVVAVVGSALRHGRSRREVWVALGVAVALVMVLVRMGIGPAERTHLFEYGLLAVLVYRALFERRRNGARVPIPAVTAAVLTALVGWLDEGIQALVPNRVYDVRDVGVNALAAVVAVVATSVIRFARDRVASRSSAGSEHLETVGDGT